MAKRIIIAEAHADAPEPLRGAPDGSGYRDMAALQMRISDSRLLCLIRHMLRVCVQEPNGVRISPKGRGTPQGGVISPLLANIYLHWFETIVSLTAKACGQVMSIVRYAEDFVILARAWADGFLQKVEGILEGRMELTVNRDKTKLLDFREAHATLTFLGYDFRMVRDRLFGTGKRYLTFGPSKKSMKRDWLKWANVRRAG